jgi:hypothetical protein
MKHPVGWETSAARYAAIYGHLLGRDASMADLSRGETEER